MSRALREEVSLAMRALLRAWARQAGRPEGPEAGEALTLALTEALTRAAFLALAESTGLRPGWSWGDDGLQLSGAQREEALGGLRRALAGGSPYALGQVYSAARRWSAAPCPRKGWRLVPRATEAHYTPPALARWLAERALAGPWEGSPRVCDPTMGAGALLLAACEVLGGQDHARRLHVARASLCGVDLDPGAVEAAKLSLWLCARAERWGLDFMDHALRRGDALEASTWALDAPFDVCLLNPPFGRAAPGLPERARLCSALLPRLLRPQGAYGAVLPQACARRPWVARLEALWPTRARCEVPLGAFGQAQVRALAQVGAASPRAQLGDAPPTPQEAPPASPHPALGGHVEVRAGCVTALAYALRGWITDDARRGGPALITTGSLERFGCLWGARKTRYLGRDYAHPRWPAEAVPDELQRALDAQRGPKVLLGGLARSLEAWCDAQGEAAGVVSVWVLRPKERADALACKALAVLLNSASFSRLFWARNDAPSTARGHATVKKAALLATPAPDLWGDEPTLRRLAALYDALSAPKPTEETERAAHLAVSGLYGRSAREAQDELDAWRARHAGPPGRRATLGS